ncbi:MAG: hypothetical protein V1837_01070 [Candidatus Woesearchaeota archaeon]
MELNNARCNPELFSNYLCRLTRKKGLNTREIADCMHFAWPKYRQGTMLQFANEIKSSVHPYYRAFANNKKYRALINLYLLALQPSDSEREEIKNRFDKDYPWLFDLDSLVNTIGNAKNECSAQLKTNLQVLLEKTPALSSEQVVFANHMIGTLMQYLNTEKTKNYTKPF